MKSSRDKERYEKFVSEIKDLNGIRMPRCLFEIGSQFGLFQAFLKVVWPSKSFFGLSFYVCLFQQTILVILYRY